MCWPDCAYAQAGLRLCCSQTSKDRLSPVKAQFYSHIKFARQMLQSNSNQSPVTIGNSSRWAYAFQTVTKFRKLRKTQHIHSFFHSNHSMNTNIPTSNFIFQPVNVCIHCSKSLYTYILIQMSNHQFSEMVVLEINLIKGLSCKYTKFARQTFSLTCRQNAKMFQNGFAHFPVAFVVGTCWTYRQFQNDFTSNSSFISQTSQLSYCLSENSMLKRAHFHAVWYTPSSRWQLNIANLCSCEVSVSWNAKLVVLLLVSQESLLHTPTTLCMIIQNL